MTRTPLLGFGLALLIVAGAFFVAQRTGPDSPSMAPESAESTPAQTADDASTAAAQIAASTADPSVVQVWKSPTCGCCTNWIEHMEAAGFEVEAHDVPDVVAVKARYGIPPSTHSCHTALVDGYLIEGHVPAEDVQRLLEERPEVTGLAVPGMPLGSPGMEVGNQKDPYDVLTFAGDGSTTVYSSH